MNALNLPKVSSAVAQASRLLGAGVSRRYSAQGQRGELTLRPLAYEARREPALTWFDSAIGCFALSDAEALLSLLGELPVTLGGEYQPWYWQRVNQRLSLQWTELLCPLQPLSDITEAPIDACDQNTAMTFRLELRLGSQVLHGQICAAAPVMLRLLGSQDWQRQQHALPDAWPISQPLVLAELSLSLDQLASLQPGDVLLPPLCHFNAGGDGRLQLAGRQWAVQTDSCTQQLQVRFSHEEDLGHGQ